MHENTNAKLQLALVAVELAEKALRTSPPRALMRRGEEAAQLLGQAKAHLNELVMSLAGEALPTW